MYVLGLEELGGGTGVLPCPPPSPALSHSSHCWRESYRQNYLRGLAWCRGATPSPPGSLWLWWVRAWTVSGPMTSTVVGQVGRLPQHPVLPWSLGPLMLRLADHCIVDTIKTHWAPP